MATAYWVINELPSSYTPEYGDLWVIVSTWVRYIYDGTSWVEDGHEIFELENANNANITYFPSAANAFLIWNTTTALNGVSVGNLTMTRTFTLTDTAEIQGTVYFASPSPSVTITLDGVQMITVSASTNTQAITGTWSITPGEHTIAANITNTTTTPMWVAFALYDPTNSAVPYPVISDLNWIGEQASGQGVVLENDIDFTAPDSADALYPEWNSIGYMNPSWFAIGVPTPPSTSANLINPTTAYLTFLFYYPICNQSFIFIA